ncbi:restriction endonuclease subunit S [Salinispirillum sp. LH 10-3-1]|uniref:Restriction endonuclease subunit S n=1 Tax=Salinispirillum sp. LH 10-3-1 TaxID=2952525 RepID=A0AB38YJ11_9GAMM
MSSEWVLQKLSTLGTFDRGKSKHRPRDAAHLYGGPYPFIQTGDVTASGGRITTYRQTYSEAGLAQSRLWPVNTLCITIAANIAETGLLTFPACFPDSVVGFTADPKKADIRFIEYIFQAFRASVKSKAYGSVQENINLEVLRNLEFPIPSLNNQKKIADFFTLIDDRIALLRETNTTLEAIAQALFKSWFVDFDPVHANAGTQAPSLPADIQALFPSRLVESPQGLIPEGWEWKQLVEAYEINPKRQLKKGAVAKYLDMASVQTQGHVTADVIEREFGSGTKFCNGDTLLARITPCLENGKTAFVDFLDPDEIGWGSTEFVVLKPKAPLPDFHGYLLARQSVFRDFAIQSMSGTSGRQRVQNDVLGSFTIAMPDERVANAFSQVVTPIQQSISANHRKAQTLANLRDTLLPRLISGQLRLPEAEVVLVEVS